MPEPLADVFGEIQAPDEIPSAEVSADEDQGLLGGTGEFKMNGGPGPTMLLNGVDEGHDESVSTCCKFTLCCLGVFCLCVFSFFLGTQWEAGTSHTVNLDEQLEELQDWQEAFPAASPPTTTTTTSAKAQSVEDPMSLSSLDSIEKALACIRLTTPQQEARYPEDAEKHFEEIYHNVTTFVPMDFPAHGWAGYKGPWIENHWIKNFSQRWFERAEGTRLRDIFGPFIPIFVPWVDLAVRTRAYPNGMIPMLKEKMRADVLYITVSQHDLGIFWGARNTRIKREDFPNLFVFSAGGYGHVPVPLLKQPEMPLAQMPFAERRYFVSFVGSATNKARNKMKATAEEWSNRTQKDVLVSMKHMSDWKEVLQKSAMALVPRGFGRSSFRTGEIFQMGRVPLYLWDDEPWIFYRELWQKELIGFSYPFPQLEEALDHIAHLGLNHVETMENRILSMRNSHFTYEGIMDQISKFMTGRDGGSDLRCQKYPWKRLRRLQMDPSSWLEWLQSWAMETLI